MKAHQKWNIAAQAGLGIIIALAIFATWILMVYIVPKVIFFHQEKGSVIPAYFQMPVNVCEITSRYWFLWASLLFGAVGWFEWKCSCQNAEGQHRQKVDPGPTHPSPGTGQRDDCKEPEADLVKDWPMKPALIAILMCLCLFLFSGCALMDSVTWTIDGNEEKD